MPKLNANTAAAVDKVEAAGDGFPPVPDGTYECCLKEVTAKDGPSGTYWVWEFVIPEGAKEYAGRRFWTNTSLGEASRPFLKRMFDAFNVSADTDTDLLCGHTVNVRVKTVIQPVGAKAGEPKNEVVTVTAFDGDPVGVDDDDLPY